MLTKSLENNWSGTWLTGFPGLPWEMRKGVHFLTNSGTLGYLGDIEKREVHPNQGIAGEI